jgi:glycosyltransferase involved in cell wall biosynthesis
MKIAILTPVFLGEIKSLTGVKGDLIGGAEVYLHMLIKKVLEPLASKIVVYQKEGVSTKFSEKTSVVKASALNKLDLDSFDLVIINGLQFIFPEVPSFKARSVAIHHGMVLPPSLTLDVLKIYYEYPHWFHISHKDPTLYRSTRTLFGEKLVDASLRLSARALKLLQVLLYEYALEKERKYSITMVNRYSTKVDYVVSVDKDSLRYVYPSKETNWRVNYNFVDLDWANSDIRRQTAFSGVTIFVPRNLVPARGVFIIPKLACLLKEYGHHNFRFLVAGTGHLQPFLENEIKRLSLENEVKLLGHKDHFRDMPRLYIDSDIVLVPTFSNEGTSLAVLEGMAFRKPVVTTDVGGLNDIGVNGKHKLSSTFNIRKIARNIVRLLEDKDLTKRVAEAGYEYVCRNHDINLWKEKWQEVIEEF